MKIFVLMFCALVIVFNNAPAQPVAFIDTDFRKADSVAALYPHHSLKDLKLLADKLTKPFSTEEEKFRTIYKWVCNNIVYDYDLYLKNKVKKQKLRSKEDIKTWNKQFSTLVTRNLLNKQKSVCAGYAYLVKELTTHAGLACVEVDGYGRTSQANIRMPGSVNHSWNAVQLNKKWYLCDATWSSGSVDTETGEFVKKYDDAYFLPEPSLFVRNHYPSDSTWMLLYHKPTLKEFLNRPLVYSGVFRHGINQLLPETFDVTTQKGKTVTFQFTKNGDKPIEKVQLYIKGSKTESSVSPPLTREKTGFYTIDHVFATRGTYIVHVLLNYGYAFTYTVRVM